MNIRIILFLCFLFASFVANASMKKIYDLRTNYEVSPMCVEQSPVFSWKMNAGNMYKAAQRAYRILLSKQEDFKDVFYDTGKKYSSKSVSVKYEGLPLEPCTQYFWKVQIWDEKNNMIESETSWFETCLLNSGWSNAQWIGSQEEGLSRYSSNLIFNYDVMISKKGESASFVFGVLDQQNYWGAKYVVDINEKPSFCFYHVVGGVTIIDANVDLTKYLDARSLYGMHKITLVNRPEEFNRYEITLKIDDKEVAASPNSTPFILSDKKWNQMCRMLAIGYEQPQNVIGSISNIVISDFSKPVVFYKDSTVHQFDGSGNLCFWTPKKDVAAPLLRKMFKLKGKVKKARVYSTARGIYELSINGKNVNYDFFNPGWTDYNKRIMYNIFDITSFLRQGENVIGCCLGEGWWKGIRYYNPKWYNHYGASLSFLGKIIVEYENGEKETFITDDSWKCSNDGPVLTNGFYEGEDYDARREIPEWNSYTYDASQWMPCKVYPSPDDHVIISPYIGQPARMDSLCVAKKVTEPTPKTFVYDMGQNMVGVPRIYIKGYAGQTITLNYAEMLYPDIIPVEPVAPYTIDEYKEKQGQIYTENYRSAMNTDHYILKGNADGEIFEPHFTCHGFRYLQITGIDEPLPLENVKVVVINSLQDQDNCKYNCSNELINKLFSNIQWGERGNFVSIPTDCPQRDERAGWTGDAQIFCRTAMYNRNVAPFYHRWLCSVRDDQLDNGGYPDVVPNSIWNANYGWGDLGVILPWQLYQQYCDEQILLDSYESMKKYVDYIEKRATDFIQPFGGYGDWVAFSMTQSDLTNTCYAAYSVQLMEKIASVLKKDADKKHYEELFNNIKKAFNKRYVDTEGYMISPIGSAVEYSEYGVPSSEKVTSPTRIKKQTAYVVPLFMNMIEDSLRLKVSAHLAEFVKENGYKLNTGFIGTPYINIVLSDFGYTDIAYRLFEQQEFPSWIYPVLQGATTMWERWNSYTIKNGFGPVSMNSFNHYAYGAIQDWMIAYSAGIQRDENNPGYKHILLQPQVGGHLTHVHSEFNSVYGKIVSSWKSDNADETKNSADYGFTYMALVPANTTATLTLQTAEKCIKILEGKKGIFSKSFVNGTTKMELSSGIYKFYISK